MPEVRELILDVTSLDLGVVLCFKETDFVHEVQTCSGDPITKPGVYNIKHTSNYQKLVAYNGLNVSSEIDFTAY